MRCYIEAKSVSIRNRVKAPASYIFVSERFRRTSLHFVPRVYTTGISTLYLPPVLLLSIVLLILCTPRLNYGTATLAHRFSAKHFMPALPSGLSERSNSEMFV